LDKVSHLDAAKGDDLPSKKQTTGGKLRKNLEKEQKSVLDFASQGASDTTAEEIREVLNEALESSKFSYVFKGFSDASKLIEITEVTCNRDFSNTSAYWHSLPMEVFVGTVQKKLGDKEAVKYARKIGMQIETTLRSKEGMMRSYLMRKMDFKRVPRIMFYCADPSFGLNREQQQQRNRSAYSAMSAHDDDFSGSEGEDVEEDADLDDSDDMNVDEDNEDEDGEDGDGFGSEEDAWEEFEEDVEDTQPGRERRGGRSG
jgi:ribosome-binding factor A